MPKVTYEIIEFLALTLGGMSLFFLIVGAVGVFFYG